MKTQSVSNLLSCLLSYNYTIYYLTAIFFFLWSRSYGLSLIVRRRLRRLLLKSVESMIRKFRRGNLNFCLKRRNWMQIITKFWWIRSWPRLLGLNAWILGYLVHQECSKVCYISTPFELLAYYSLVRCSNWLSDKWHSSKGSILGSESIIYYLYIFIDYCLLKIYLFFIFYILFDF